MVINQKSVLTINTSNLPKFSTLAMDELTAHKMGKSSSMISGMSTLSVEIVNDDSRETTCPHSGIH